VKHSNLLFALLLALAAAVLTGCAHNTRPDAPIVREKPVPVLVPCTATEPTKPAWIVDALPLDSDVWTQMAALRAERKQRQGYEGELVAALRSCTNAPKLEKAP
jgi:hypothetical protein